MSYQLESFVWNDDPPLIGLVYKNTKENKLYCYEITLNNLYTIPNPKAQSIRETLFKQHPFLEETKTSESVALIDKIILHFMKYRNDNEQTNEENAAHEGNAARVPEAPKR